MPRPFEPGSLYDVLAQLGDFLFPPTDFPAPDPQQGGQCGHPYTVLSMLVLLQCCHQWSEEETARRATMDLQVKACLGLGIEEKGPSQSTINRHRKLMRKLGLDVLYEKKLRDLLEALGLVDDDEPVLVDSGPVNGAGQQLDTYNLLAAATRKSLQLLATYQHTTVEAVADSMGLSPYVARSVKGRFEVDWEKAEARRAFLGRLVDDVLKVRAALAGCVKQSEERTETETCTDGESQPDDEVAMIELIDQVLEHDIERDDEGLVKGVHQRAAGDRPISVTDPDMRHGRKSASQLIAGYKVQVVASLVYGFIVMTQLIKANEHDGQALPAMAKELEEQEIRPRWWAGDHAYGTLANHEFFAERDPDGQPVRGELVARMPRPANGGRFTKDEFSYDFGTHTLTCPANVSVQHGRWSMQAGRKGRLFVFPTASCCSCPLRAACLQKKAGKDKGRSVFIDEPRERLIRAHLERREQPDFKRRLSKRPQVERVIAGLAQCGGKQARRFGRAEVGFDIRLSSLAYNLKRLGGLMKKNELLQARLDQLLERHTHKRSLPQAA